MTVIVEEREVDVKKDSQNLVYNPDNTVITLMINSIPVKYPTKYSTLSTDRRNTINH